MTLHVVGAGLPRTGTTSLKSALEHLLDGRCYHMIELANQEDAGLLWWKALHGDGDALTHVLQGYNAAVDWPASLLWRELMERHPQALVVLSHRGAAETWWASVNKTVWAMMRRPDDEQAFAQFNAKMRECSGLADDWDDPTAAMNMYQRHYDDVVATVPSERLLIWQPGDGWTPLCAALGVDVPDQDFFHLNDTAHFRQAGGLDSVPTE